MTRSYRLFGIAILFIAVLGVLWAFPLVFFPRPAINETIGLSNLELPILLTGLLGGIVAVVAYRDRRATAVRIGVGLYLLGVAADLLVGLAVFGNLSDDSFLPLVLLPVPIGLVGLIGLLVGLLARGRVRHDVYHGLGNGLAGAIFVGIWILLRGARDWRLAPYGFDVIVLVVVVGAAVVAVGARPLRVSAEAGVVPTTGP